MLLVNHFSNFILEISTLLFYSISLGLDFIGKGKKDFGCFMEGLIVLLGEGVLYFV